MIVQAPRISTDFSAKSFWVWASCAQYSFVNNVVPLSLADEQQGIIYWFNSLASGLRCNWTPAKPTPKAIKITTTFLADEQQGIIYWFNSLASGLRCNWTPAKPTPKAIKITTTYFSMAPKSPVYNNSPGIKVMPIPVAANWKTYVANPPTAPPACLRQNAHRA